MKSNTLYVKSLLKTYDIEQELWTNESDNLEEILDCRASHKAFHKPAQKNRGRPHGGIGWLAKRVKP